MGTPRTASNKGKGLEGEGEAQPATPPSSKPGEDGNTPPQPISHGAEWEWITPDEASKMLKHNEVNRDMRQNDLDSYVRMMKDGTWGVCVEALVFDVNGNLINGQHRLTAQQVTETGQWWLVLRDAPVSVQKTVNAGARARLADVLKYNGETNYVILAGVVGNSYLWAHDLLGSSVKAQPLEGELWLEEHPDLRHSAEIGRQVAQASVIDLGAIVLGTAHWIIAQENGVYEADRFLMRMAQLHNEQPGSPIIALLNRLNKGNSEKTQRPTIRDQIAVVIKVWNFDVEGRFTKRIIIGNRGVFTNPVALKKDNPMTEEEFAELPGLKPMEEIIPPDTEIVDEGEESPM